jgi:GT2 family glycosyltransferase
MDLSVITVTWNSKEHIAEQIRSVFSGCKTISCEEIVVDNGSKDNTVQIVKKEFPEVHVIVNENNEGFGAANNAGLEKATGRYVLFLNPDMQVMPESLDAIVAWMDENNDVGIASPKLNDQHGNLNLDATPRRFPRLLEQIALVLKVPHVFPSILDKYHMLGFDSDREQDVDSVRGSFMIVRRELIDKLGWAFDPRYFIWYEDVDICREAKKHGYRVVYTPVISAIDYVGQSFKKQKTLWKQKQFTKSMLTYYKKWEPGYKSIWIAILRPVGIFLAWLHDKI